MRSVVYAGTRNLYKAMEAAAKSLLDHTEVDEIFFLTEDSERPGHLPDIVRWIDVSEIAAEIFPEDGPNRQTRYTWMTLVRTALTMILQEREKVLSLDVDTIVCEDLAPLWDVDMGGSYYGLCLERCGQWRPYGERYFNFGVGIHDLKAIRESGIDEYIIRAINTEPMPYPEQDAVNKLCGGKIKDLPERYNSSFCCGYSDRPAIIHYAGVSDWITNRSLQRHDLLEKYMGMDWSGVI